MKNPIDAIEDLLIKKLEPTQLVIDDISHKHLHHPGHQKGKQHLQIEIESPVFKNLSKLDQHKMVMDLLKPYLDEDLHSVKLQTKIPTE